MSGDLKKARGSDHEPARGSSAADWSKGRTSMWGRVARKAFRRPVACVLWKPLTTSITETVESV